jgi:hypothetical protein
MVLTKPIVRSTTHPLPTRHELIFLKTFQHVFDLWDAEATKEKALAEMAEYQKAHPKDYTKKLALLNLFRLISDLLQSIVSFAYLYDSLLECIKNNKGSDAAKRNIVALVYYTARAYIHIDQGLRFAQKDDTEDDGILFRYPTKKRKFGYTRCCLDEFLHRNRRASLYQSLGISLKIRKRINVRNIIDAADDLMNKGYWDDFDKVCSDLGMKRSDVENNCSNPANMIKLPLKRTLQINCGQGRFDVFARFAGTDGTRNSEFVAEANKAPSLKKEAISRANEERKSRERQEEAQRQQQEVVRAAKGPKKRQLKLGGRSVTNMERERKRMHELEDSENDDISEIEGEHEEKVGKQKRKPVVNSLNSDDDDFSESEGEDDESSDKSIEGDAKSTAEGDARFADAKSTVKGDAKSTTPPTAQAPNGDRSNSGNDDVGSSGETEDLCPVTVQTPHPDLTREQYHFKFLLDTCLMDIIKPAISSFSVDLSVESVRLIVCGKEVDDWERKKLQNLGPRRENYVLHLLPKRKNTM